MARPMGPDHLGELTDRELLPSMLRADARSGERVLGRRWTASPRGEGGPQRLAPLGKGRVDTGEDICTLNIGGWWLTAIQADQPGVHIGDGPEDRS